MFKSYGLCGCDDSDFSIDMNALRAKTKDKQNGKRKNIRKMDKNIISKLQAIYNETGFDELLKNLLQIAKEDDISQKDTEKLAESFFDIIAGGGDYFDDYNVEFFEFIYQKFPKSKILKNYLIDIYGALASNGIGDEYLSKMELLIGKKPENENVAKTKVDALENKYWEELHTIGIEPDWDKCIKNVNKIEEIFNWYPQSEYVALRFAEALEALTLKQDIEACKITIQRLEKVFEHAKVNQFPKTDWFANRFTSGLCRLSKKQNEQESQKTINRIEKIAAQFPDELVYANLAYALEKFSQYKSGKEKKQVINRLMEISKIWEPAQRMADRIRCEWIWKHFKKMVYE